MQNTTTIQKNGSSCYIYLDNELALSFLDKGHKRVICTIDKSFEIHCAILRSNQLGYYIMLGKKTLKAGNLNAGQEIQFELKVDNTKYQSLIPDTLKEVLDSDFEAHEKFHKLSPGKQRSIIYLVTGVKSTDTQIERALKIMENIKIGITNNRDLLK